MNTKISSKISRFFGGGSRFALRWLWGRYAIMGEENMEKEKSDDELRESISHYFSSNAVETWEGFYNIDTSQNTCILSNDFSWP